MPSISGRPDRHVVIDRREGHYLCFPDVCNLGGGRIVCAYEEYDQHAATRRALLIKISDDEGRTWSEARRQPVVESHCPRLSLIGKELHLLDHNGRELLLSTDSAETWTGPLDTGIRSPHAIFDRPLPREDGSILSTGHRHHGDPLPLLRQAPSQQAVFCSTDRGRTYQPLSFVYDGTDLVLCEASLCALDDGRIAALLRENSMVYEPMYLSFSADQGRTWSAPEPTPLVGHRPTLGRTASGKLLVTYRDVGPDSGTAAWLGTLDELRGPYMVHGLPADHAFFDARGMHLPLRHAPLRWALRPLTDPSTPDASAELECEVMVRGTREGDPNGSVGVHFGGLGWSIGPDRITATLPAPGNNDGDGSSLCRDIPAQRMNILAFSYACNSETHGVVTLRVNGEVRAEVAVNPQQAAVRVMAFGSTDRASDGEALWKRAMQRVAEPRLGRDYRWEWNADQGTPDAPKRARVLELDNDRSAHYGDFGYSGWCEPRPGRFFCAYHHAASEEPGYTPSFSAHVRGAWFSEDDFPPAP